MSITWNTGGFNEYYYSGALLGSWNTSGFGLVLFNGIQPPKFLNTVSSNFVLHTNNANLTLCRQLVANLKHSTNYTALTTVLSVNRVIHTNYLVGQLTFSSVELYTNRFPFVLNGNSLTFQVNPYKSNVSLEINMFMSLSLSEQDKKDIAAAIINTSQVTPVKAEIVGQLVPSAIEIANSVVNNPKTLTVAKFVGLK